MQLTADLAKALHRLNELALHRDEQSFLDVRDTINDHTEIVEDPKDDDDTAEDDK